MSKAGVAMSGRSRLVELRRKVAKVSANTKKIHEDVVVKRKRKRDENKVLVPPPDNVEAFKLERPATSTDVERWFRVRLVEMYGQSFIIPPWMVKQRTLAKKLLGTFGSDIVQGAVNLFCDRWPEIVRKSRGRFGGPPTINLLWGMREEIFALAQGVSFETGKPQDKDEYRPEDGGGDNEIGWE